jgi:hypothetical protein
MKSMKLLALAFGVSLVLLSGCAQLKTARILSQDDAQVAITLNKDYSVSVIAINDGERITSCKIPNMKEQRQSDSTGDECPRAKTKAKKDAKILYKDTYNVIVKEGSICISIWAGNYEFEFCDPPYKLTF